MGWWNIPGKENLVIGDDILDITYRYLKEIRDSYKDDLDRKPTIEELEYLLNLSFRVNLDDDILENFENMEIKSLTLKTQKRLKKKEKIKPGDIFSFKINDGRYCFGRAINVTKNGTFIEIFDYISNYPVFDYAKLDKWLIDPLVISASILFEKKMEGEWSIIGETPNYEPSEKLKKSIFYYGDGISGDYYTKNIYGNQLGEIPTNKIKGMYSAQTLHRNYGVLELIDEALDKRK